MTRMVNFHHNSCLENQNKSFKESDHFTLLGTLKLENPYFASFSMLKSLAVFYDFQNFWVCIDSSYFFEIQISIFVSNKVP